MRVERSQENALALAGWLDDHPKVEWVHYPGLVDSPSHKIAKQQFGEKGFGGLLTFGLKDEKSCFEFIRNVKMAYHLANLGDSKTLAIHPASTTHRQLSEEEQLAAGVSPDMIRLSVGLETLDDILWDLDQALTASAG